MAKAHDSVNVCNTMDETVTVKFSANNENGYLFTKAFTRETAIKDISSELANLLRIPNEQIISLQCGDRTLEEHTKLATLGVEALGSIELKVNTSKICKLNKNLLYGHIPTLDVITVRVKDEQRIRHLVVEIEDGRCEKEWLGGYRDIKMLKYYHHACTQTCQIAEQVDSDRRTRCAQTRPTKNVSINTTSDKYIQASPVIGYLPSKSDKLLSTTLEKKYEQPNLDKEESNNLVSIRTQIRQCKSENARTKISSECEQSMEEVKHLEQTTKLIRYLDRCELKLRRAIGQQKELTVVDNYMKPLTFKNKTGKVITIQTQLNKKAAILRDLLLNYEKTIAESIQVASLKNVATEMKLFFNSEGVENDRYSEEISDLLDEQIHILECQQSVDEKTRRCLRALGSRIRQRIKHFLMYSEDRFNRIDDCETHTTNACYSCSRKKAFSLSNAHALQPYRDILSSLQKHELLQPNGFMSICFKLRAEEMEYLIRHIWSNRPISLNDEDTSDSDHFETNNLMLTRWIPTQPWSPWNCILLTQYQYNQYWKTINLQKLRHTNKSLISQVQNRHLQAKIYFTRLLTRDYYPHEKLEFVSKPD